MKPKLLIILGPTGVGKSKVAIDCALEIGAEIINADSQQVYRHMNIGAGKPTPEHLETVAHHLIDIVDPDQEFNAAMFRDLATKSFRDIRSRGREVILCGGTGLYMKALTRGIFVGAAKNPEVRQCLEEQVEEEGLPSLYKRLRDVDPDATSWIHPNDRQRIIRALEVFETTGMPISRWQKEHRYEENLFEVLKIGLDRAREELYALINQRSDEMIAKGLVDEVKGLIEQGYSLDLRPMKSVGYRHMGLYLSGKLTLDEAVTLMKRDTRHLARRQLTWFRADKEIRWFHPEREGAEILKAAKEFFRDS